MTITDSQLAERLSGQGQIWTPDASKMNNVDCADGLALQFFGYIEPALQGVMRAKCPDATLRFVFIDKPGINAFACRFSKNSRYYIIGIRSGLFHEIIKFFYDPKVETILRQHLPVLACWGSPTLARFCCSFSSVAIVFHEFAHVVRGHIEYLGSIGALDENVSGIEEILEGTSAADEKQNRARYLMECDADTRGGRFTAAEVLNQITAIVQRYPEELKEQICNELLQLASISIHAIFRLMESFRKSLPVNYPPHLVRSAIMNTQLIQGIEDMLLRAPDYVAIADIQMAVTSGLTIANLIHSEMNLSTLSYDAEEYAQRWVDNDAKDVDALGSLLASHTPCRAK